MMDVIDAAAREKATDPAHSYIVQAPAGSGKTEILTQRFLRLLATVAAPEQIIALTFTRKAANEMRERIVLALQQTAQGAQPSSPHQQKTYSYAAQALAQSQDLDWNILEQPNRLRIITIDSLCYTLTQAIPLAEKQVPFAEISDHAQAFYQDAARACLSYALEQKTYHEPLKNITAPSRQSTRLFTKLIWRIISDQRSMVTTLISSTTP